MGNKNYERGRDLEYIVKKIFSDAGWKAQRTAGSHSEWDLICVKEGTKYHDEVWVLMLQCKRVKRGQK